MPFWNSTKKVRPVAGTDVAGTDVAGTDVAGSDAEIRKGMLFASLYMLNQFCDIKHIGDNEMIISNEDRDILIELIALANKHYDVKYNSEYHKVFEFEVRCELPEFILKLNALQTKVTPLNNTSLDALLNKLIESLKSVNSLGGGRNKTSRKTKKRKHRK